MQDTLSITFGQRLKEIREQRGFTQSDLVKKCGIKSPSVIANWEANNNKPDIDKFMRLCNALSVSPNFLLGYDLNDNVSNIVKTIARQIEQMNEFEKDEIIEHINRLSLGQTPKYIHERLDENPGGIYLESDDPDYAEMVAKAPDLLAQKQLSHRSTMDVTKFLLDFGYPEEQVCYSFMVQVFAGLRIPGPLLYERMYAYCTHDLKFSHKDGSEL